jgi:hypothetical protein
VYDDDDDGGDCDDDDNCDVGVGAGESDDDDDDDDNNDVRYTLFYTNIHLLSLLFIQTPPIPLVVDIFRNHSHLLMLVTYQI